MPPLPFAFDQLSALIPRSFLPLFSWCYSLSHVLLFSQVQSSEHRSFALKNELDLKKRKKKPQYYEKLQFFPPFFISVIYGNRVGKLLIPRNFAASLSLKYVSFYSLSIRFLLYLQSVSNTRPRTRLQLDQPPRLYLSYVSDFKPTLSMSSYIQRESLSLPRRSTYVSSNAFYHKP